MPFRSERQRRFLYAKHPEIAKRWTAEHGSKPQPKKAKPKAKKKTTRTTKKRRRHDGVWLSTDEIMQKPTSGAAWDALKKQALAAWGTAKVSDRTACMTWSCLAGALYATRMNDNTIRTKTANGCKQAIGTEAGGQELALGRNLAAYVLPPTRSASVTRLRLLGRRGLRADAGRHDLEGMPRAPREQLGLHGRHEPDRRRHLPR